jgi:hypothetical protein
MRGRRLSYTDYLNTAWWAHIRARTLSFYNHTCVVCGETSLPLECHHVSEAAYRRRWHERVGDVVPLCALDHEIATERWGERKKYGNLERVEPMHRDRYRVPYAPRNLTTAENARVSGGSR